MFQVVRATAAREGRTTTRRNNNNTKGQRQLAVVAPKIKCVKMSNFFKWEATMCHGKHTQANTQTQMHTDMAETTTTNSPQRRADTPFRQAALAWQKIHLHRDSAQTAMCASVCVCSVCVLCVCTHNFQTGSVKCTNCNRRLSQTEGADAILCLYLNSSSSNSAQSKDRMMWSKINCDI